MVVTLAVTLCNRRLTVGEPRKSTLSPIIPGGSNEFQYFLLIPIIPFNFKQVQQFPVIPITF